MLHLTRQHLRYLLLLCIFAGFGLAIDLVNASVFHFHNVTDELVTKLLSILLCLSLLTFCLYRLGDVFFPIAELLRDLLLFLGFALLIGWVTGCIQFTPFKPVDVILMKLDYCLGVDVGECVTWLHDKPRLSTCLWFIYLHTTHLIIAAVVLTLLLKKRGMMNEFYELVLIATGMGYMIYYFFPTLAPASVFSSPYFTSAQHATALKFNQLHHYQIQTTYSGGLIAFPSFHVIWTWFATYLLRYLPWLFRVLLIYNVLLMIACVLLGWHYFVDILGSVVVVVVSYGIRSRRWAPAFAGETKLSFFPP